MPVWRPSDGSIIDLVSPKQRHWATIPVASGILHRQVIPPIAPYHRALTIVLNSTSLMGPARPPDKPTSCHWRRKVAFWSRLDVDHQRAESPIRESTRVIRRASSILKIRTSELVESPGWRFLSLGDIHRNLRLTTALRAVSKIFTKGREEAAGFRVIRLRNRRCHFVLCPCESSLVRD